MTFTNLKKNKMQNHKYQQLSEGLEYGDLARLVHPELHADEFKSKMGEDKDIVVLSFKVTDKEPALDLVNFIEKSYDWVLDSDASAGELEDGDFLVFAELERTPDVPDNVMEMIGDIINLTEQGVGEWLFQYQKTGKTSVLSRESLAQIPATPDAYVAKYGDSEADESSNQSDIGDEIADELTAPGLDKMQEAARVPMNRKAPVNEFTDSLRIAAGLK